MERLREDVSCSICLDIFKDPVSIKCGHNFCRGCLSAHWSRVSAQGYQCPECRAPCSRDRMIPDTRLKSLVEKITEQRQEETEQQGPELELDLGHPVQLVHLDEKGDVILDKEALSRCLEQGGVGDAPVCLVSIIGEQRRGKSFLMNYLLRLLRSQEASEGSWMGWEDEPLEGFEWRMGIQRVTEGVWAWSQPFWVPADGGKVAVLLVDTEGSMDVGSNKETSIKLSALSMLLSSYQILNIGCQVTDTDLEYLEMFLHVAEVVGEAYGLEPIQHLDLLVRDWSCSPEFGANGGKECLRHIREMLAATSPCKHPKALETLERSSTHCYVMPFPGTGITTGSAGRLRDMDKNFRESLRGYVNPLVDSLGQHVRRDQHGELLSGTQLAAKIKNLSDVMKKRRFGFSSPCQMAITFHNQRAMDRARMDHAAFLREKEALSQRRIECLRVAPSAMADLCAEQRRLLLERCRVEMKEPEKETLLAELEAELTREAETFLEAYRRRYQCHTINQRALDRVHTDHAAFLREKDALAQDRIECLRVAPSAMAEQCAEQRRLLLERCWEEMMEPEKETLLAELEAELTREAETFLETYGRRYQHHTINQRAMDRVRTEHAAFLREKDALSQRRIDCLRVAPSVVAEQFVEQRRLLLERYRELMMEPEKETLLAELEADLSREAETFLETYERRYQHHTINQRAMARARTEHAAFLREKDALSQRRIECLRVAPNAIMEQFVEQRRLLLERCQEEMMETEETLLAELEAELTLEAGTFLEAYGRRYQHHTINQRALDRARRVHAAFVREKDTLSQRGIECLRVAPSAMAKQFKAQRRLLLERCREEMKESEKETLLAELEGELTREAETFLQTYGRRYQRHINQRAMDRARRDHAAFVREKDGDPRNKFHIPKVRPRTMAKQLTDQREQLLQQCRTEMREPTREEEALVTELEVELKREAENFLETYRKRVRKYAAMAGAAVGTLVLAPVGGAVGVGIAAGLVAGEAVVGLIGAGVGAAVGAVAGIGLGVGVGGGVGGNITQRDIMRAQGASSPREEEEEEEEEEDFEDPSENEPLI